MGTIILSGTLLMLPALGAVFVIGKDAIYKDLNINDSIIKTYFKYLKSALTLMKFFPIHLIMLLNVAGMLIAASSNNIVYTVVCLTLISFLVVLMFYIAGFFTFITSNVNIMEVLISMLFKPQFLMPVFIITVLCGFYFSFAMLIVLSLAGTFFLFAIEVIIFIQMLYYRKLTGNLKEDEEFAYLINRQNKKG
jgi:hypothetical protein